MLAAQWMRRLAIGWGIAAIASLLGLWTSYKVDLPTGAAIVCAAGILLAVVSVTAAALGKKRTDANRTETYSI